MKKLWENRGEKRRKRWRKDVVRRTKNITFYFQLTYSIDKEYILHKLGALYLWCLCFSNADHAKSNNYWQFTGDRRPLASSFFSFLSLQKWHCVMFSMVFILSNNGRFFLIKNLSRCSKNIESIMLIFLCNVLTDPEISMRRARNSVCWKFRKHKRALSGKVRKLINSLCRSKLLRGPTYQL